MIKPACDLLTVKTNKKSALGVPANNFFYARRVPANNFLFAGRVPANNLFLNFFLSKQHPKYNQSVIALFTSTRVYSGGFHTGPYC